MAVAETLNLNGVLQGIRGRRAFARRTRETRSSNEKPSLVALHEAAHVFVALATGTADPKSANIIPHGMVEGTTWLSNFSAVVAAAGEAIGDHAGAGGDRQIAANEGVNWKRAVEGAKAAISGNMHVIYALASALQKWKELGSGDLRDVYSEAKNGAEVMITFTDETGDTQTETTRTKPGTHEVKVPAWLFVALMEAAGEEAEDLKKEGVTVGGFPKRNTRGVKVDVVTEKDLADLQRDV
ncbi:hypothetical protein K2P56_03320 [Patescibacteria group bacterium]|nr:hypothetical protein [Patescibacteria group bacterium]